MNYDEAVQYIFNIPRFDSRGKTGNENLKQVLKLLGNPHMACRCIHIAGTNGKGSTAQFISSILVSAGFSTGIFTSPHLVRVNERMVTVFDGIKKTIDDEEFLVIFNTVKEKNDILMEKGNPHISFFEFVFAMAAVYFADKNPDFVIYETGLGGRLDATNVISPEVCVITEIGLDHTKYLGDTVEKIAYEKAGIIKKGVPVIYNTGDEKADEVIFKTALSREATAINVAKTKYIINEITDKTIDFSVSGSYYSYDNLKINSCGVYQADNALTAICACHTLFKNTEHEKNVMSYDNIKNAMSRFFWEGRMERIHDLVFLDGAHNYEAITRFVETVNRVNKNDELILFYASSNDKDYPRIIKLLCSKLKIKKVYITQLASDRAVALDNVKDIFAAYLKDSCRIRANEDIKTAFKDAFNECTKEKSMLYCVGSLYLVGAIKELAREVLPNDKF